MHIKYTYTLLPDKTFLTKILPLKGTREDPLKPYVSSEMFAEDPGDVAKYSYKYSFHFRQQVGIMVGVQVGTNKVNGTASIRSC